MAQNSYFLLLLFIAIACVAVQSAILPARPRRKLNIHEPPSRIINGSVISRQPGYDSQASLQYQNEHYASLTCVKQDDNNAYWFTTADTCDMFLEAWDQLQGNVSVKATNRLNDIEDATNTMSVDDMWIHPDYDYYSMDNNICCVKTKKFPDHVVKPIQICDQSENKAGNKIKVAGWGGTNTNELESNDFHECVLEIISQNDYDAYCASVGWPSVASEVGAWSVDGLNSTLGWYDDGACGIRPLGGDRSCLLCFFSVAYDWDGPQFFTDATSFYYDFFPDEKPNNFLN